MKPRKAKTKKPTKAQSHQKPKATKSLLDNKASHYFGSQLSPQLKPSLQGAIAFLIPAGPFSSEDVEVSVRTKGLEGRSSVPDRRSSTFGGRRSPGRVERSVRSGTAVNSTTLAVWCEPEMSAK